MPSEKLITAIEVPFFSILRISPFPPQKFILEQLLKRLLSEQIQDGSLDFLREKTLKIFVQDAGIGWQISYIKNQLKVLPPITPSSTSPTNYHNTADVTISGTARTFILLASRQEDPDTLFFQRKLSIEGNTELGLEVKNLLDAVELDALPSVFEQTLRTMGKLAASS